MKNTIIAILVIIIVGVGAYFIFRKPAPAVSTTNTNKTVTQNTQATTTANANTAPEGSSVVIGKSVQGRDIVAYNFGSGDTRVLFIGGIHGGYSWNTALLAYQTMDYLRANPNIIPKNIKVTVIPELNPDGLNMAVGTTGEFAKKDVTASQSILTASRFNANNVDLSRNFDCDWKSVGVWQTKSVSGGSTVFSEPESQAVKNYVETHSPSAVVVWYSAAGGVYSSNCDNDLSSETNQLTNLYSNASGYPAHTTFDAYETSGDMVNWLSKIHIPAISVLLSTHTDTEWTKNLKGIEAVLAHYEK